MISPSSRLPTLSAIAALLVAAAPAGAVTPLPSDWHTGASVPEWSANGYSSSTSDATLARVQGDGGNSVEIVPTWYMSSSTSSSIGPTSYSATDASVLHATATAKSLGMRVVLKPHVDVLDGTWRGAIHPSDLTAWWRSYGAMIDHFADLAQQAGAGMLVVGTEFNTLEGDSSRWQSLIADVRSRFSGQLTYAANWDSYATVPFWSSLDYIGIDGYFPLATSSNPDPTVADLAAAWTSFTDGYGGVHNWIGDIGAVAQAVGKPVIFTEVGYQDRVGTAVTPWSSSGSIASGPQQRAYEAAFEAWSGVSFFKGFYWWDFHATGYTLGDGDWDPSGNPAEATMADWYENNASPTPVPPPPGNSRPTVTLTSPANGSTFTTTLQFGATASDDHGVKSVTFFLDGRRVASDSSAPYTATDRVQKSTSYGQHTVAAQAVDTNGLASTLSSATVTRVP
jgi:hypothetical protein